MSPKDSMAQCVCVQCNLRVVPTNPVCAVHIILSVQNLQLQGWEQHRPVIASELVELLLQSYGVALSCTSCKCRQSERGQAGMPALDYRGCLGGSNFSCGNAGI